MKQTSSDIAVEKFLSGYNCAQSVLFAYGTDLGLEGDTALKLATGLGGGMGRCGKTCGALTGGILVLGLRYGRGVGQDRSVAEVAHQKTRDLIAAFEQAHGSCECLALLDGCDLRTSEGQQRFKEQDLHHKVCGPCVRTVADWLAETLGGGPAQKAGADR